MRDVSKTNSQVRNRKSASGPEGPTPRREIGNRNSGTLYTVSTPIGNLEDITLRALRILKSVDMIAAENVAHTRGLCSHYGIKSRLTSYNQHNRYAKTPELIRRLKSGSDIALVTDAGTPGISDPGVHLINRALDDKIRVTPIPGASALVAALSVSGMATEQFLFLGFLSNKQGRRKKELKKLTSEPRTMVFFEAPHRVRDMLTDLKDILGDRQMVMLREMTKVFEEVKRGLVSNILKHVAPNSKIRGEFTLVVEGRGKKKEIDALSQETLGRIDNLLAERKLSVRDIAGLIASEAGLAYRQVYKACLVRKGPSEGICLNGTGKEV